MTRFRFVAAAAAIVAAVLAAPLARAGQTYSFGVVNQRSAVLTAQYWNPILRYVSEKSGVPLQLKLPRTAPEHSAMISRGEFDFVYSNHIFAPPNAPQGYRVFARPEGPAIRGEIVVLEDSPIRSLEELNGREVGFPSNAAFVGYHVPMDGLLKSDISVQPVFAGNQEGVMGQLKAGRVPAAGVNNLVMQAFAAREGIRYRVLWRSEEYHNIPIAAHPRVADDKVQAVREAFAGMEKDPEGAKILEASAALVKQKPPYGFLGSSDAEFDNYRRFFSQSQVAAAGEKAK